MSALRVGTTYMNPSSQVSSPLAANGVVADLATITLRYGGYVSIQCIIDNGAGGAPTDTPVGVWELYCSANGSNYTKVAACDAGLDPIKPNGNNVVEAIVVFAGVPGTTIKIRYKRTSGGAGNSRVRMLVTTW